MYKIDAVTLKIEQEQALDTDEANVQIALNGSRDTLYLINNCLLYTSRQLRQVGVEDARIEVAGICTVCHHDQFFSYRGDRGNTGRFGAGIMLNI